MRRSPRKQPSLDISKAIQLAVHLHQQGRLAEAEPLYQAILKLRPSHFDALHLLGVLYTQQGRHAAAIELIAQAIKQQPGSAEAHCNLGVALAELDRPEEALQSYEQALLIKPDHAEALCNRGNALAGLLRHADAIESYDRALAVRPDYTNALDGRGAALARLQRYEEAIESYSKALAIRPASFCALHGLGAVLANLNRNAEAIACYDKALAVMPDDATALSNRASALSRLERYEDAIAGYEQALQKDPRLPDAAGHLAFFRAHVCDWRNYDQDNATVANAVKSGIRVSPFSLVVLSNDLAAQQTCAAAYVRDKCPAVLPAHWRGEIYRHDRIRLAYLSADFHGHATAYLAAGLFERHDRSRFDMTAVSYGPDRPGPMRDRLRSSFERFLDVQRDSDRAIAQRLRELEIDIAIDLKGYTSGGRPGILAHRPAPVQVNYLGYPGTLGAEYIDYILADRFVIPPEHERYYAEKVACLPECYQVNDSKRPIAQRTPERAEVGLPGRGFVFCCFNNNYKLTPRVFDVWMRLLARVEDSVLWLLRGTAAGESNLRREAAGRGIDPRRLVFAPRVELENHLARHRLADLFLDTLPCNAHTTASDALWAGVPLVTCAGTTFAGRVAGSLLHAIGLPELIAATLEDYEALALRLATEPALLRQIRDRLERNRTSAPLFDTDRFRRHIESAYTTMWEIQQRGERPRPFAVGLSTE